jgi:hypothetical protein
MDFFILPSLFDSVLRRLSTAAIAALFAFCYICTAQQTPHPADVLVLSNGDTLHGKLVNVVGNKVTFHTDALGDVTATWDHVTELHTEQKFAVLDNSVKKRGKKDVAKIPTGNLDVQDNQIHLRDSNAPSSVPVSNAGYIVDEDTLNQEVYHRPGFTQGWKGAATAGATNVNATQSNNTISGSVGLVRIVPALTWLDPRNRTSLDFSGSYGKISQPLTPSVKTSIYHADAERDQYFSRRFYVLGMVAFDHNYSQALALQSIYGGGVGFTVFSTPVHELDLKATIQYENQEFLAIGTAPAAPTLHLVGSTFSANYAAKWKVMSFAQEVAYIPAYNDPSAYSVNETNTVAFPAYKNLSFSFGTLDSYLNNPPPSVPPVQHNSFQFTMGLTYGFKSKY